MEDKVIRSEYIKKIKRYINRHLDEILAEFGNLGAVAFTNNYQSLNGKPSIPAEQVNSDWGSSASGKAVILNKPTVVDNATSTSATDVLSARMGKELNDRINNLSARGRFLSHWNCTTGLAMTTPTTDPYEYKTGDYFIVGAVASEGGTNYKPTGTSYSVSTPSTVVETEVVNVGDDYYYDGTTWRLQVNTPRDVEFASIQGDPTDNTALANALPRTGTVTIAVADWAGGITCNKTITGLLATDFITVSPNDSSWDAVIEGKVRAKDCLANTLPFECETTPTSAVTFNYTIIPARS